MCKVRVPENKVPRNMSGPKRGGVTSLECYRTRNFVIYAGHLLLLLIFKEATAV